MKFLKPISKGYSNSEIEEVMLIHPIRQDFNVVIDVPKSRINKIKIGQRITFTIDSIVIGVTGKSIPSKASKNDTYLVEAQAETNHSFINDSENVVVHIQVNNKKIFHKILNL